MAKEAQQVQRKRRPSRRKDLTPGSFPSSRDISHVIVIKDRDLFFLTEPDGSVPLESGHGFGLFYHDCRFLNGYEVHVGQSRPEHLVGTAESGHTALIGMSNAAINRGEGTIDRHSIGIRWQRTIDGQLLTLQDSFTFQNLTMNRHEFPVSLTFLASFEDIFEIRGMAAEHHGKIDPPRWKNSCLVFAYKGADLIKRRLGIEFSIPPTEVDGSTCIFNLTLEPNQCLDLQVGLQVSESFEDAPGAAPGPAELMHLDLPVTGASGRWIESATEVLTNSVLLNRALKRSTLDLNMLRSNVGTAEYFAAGVPWFVALFGRDSIITALQTLFYDRRLAEHTILLLARMQGTRVDPWREEQPGKILHELRVGEMARLNEVPHTPYYGTVDATPLFLILIGRHAAWTGDLALFNSLRQNIELALDWISSYGDLDGDGYVEYVDQHKKGLINQGWKDSHDAIVNADGSLATPPIALVEVQAYVYQAKLEMAKLYRLSGDWPTAIRLEAEAEDLKRRFDEDFWVEDGFYALALQGDKTQAAVMSSNTGHALWTGIANENKAHKMVGRLMADDMFNGWGIRTLSDKERYYNPLGYHLGTVWPHDNSLIVAGMRKYGFDEEALKVFVGLLDATWHFDAHRLPELFAGFSKDKFGVPVSYPVACQPQAWAAGSVPYMLESMLGLMPEAFENRLRIRRPILPDFVGEVEIRRLRVGTARIDLKFTRNADSIAVKILKLDGILDVLVEL